MSTDENFASFRDGETGRFVFVDSFDNEEFNVRFGTLSESRELGVITAKSDEILNKKLQELVEYNS
ncbi:hypothetical protein H4V96_001181 [Janthinobacterium sp. CG_23.4]|nr:hypothetical protein [Janthinobacterium sp. CG_23.4]